jgi:hypothetical protein
MDLYLAWGFVGGVVLWTLTVIALDLYRRSHPSLVSRMISPPKNLRLIPSASSSLVDWAQYSEWA